MRRSTQPLNPLGLVLNRFGELSTAPHLRLTGRLRFSAPGRQLRPACRIDRAGEGLMDGPHYEPPPGALRTKPLR